MDPWASIAIIPPKHGGITIISSKTTAGTNELITLQAVGCSGEVVWILPSLPKCCQMMVALG
jgi:hypothetical protein